MIQTLFRTYSKYIRAMQLMQGLRVLALLSFALLHFAIWNVEGLRDSDYTDGEIVDLDVDTDAQVRMSDSATGDNIDFSGMSLDTWLSHCARSSKHPDDPVSLLPSLSAKLQYQGDSADEKQAFKRGFVAKKDIEEEEHLLVVSPECVLTTGAITAEHPLSPVLRR